MGRGYRKGGKRNHGGPGAGGKDWRDKKNKEKKERTDGQRGYEDMPLVNDTFEKYYKEQGLFSDDEYTQWLQALRTPLPSCFRITGSRSHAQELKDLMIEKYFNVLKSEEGEQVEIPTPLPWYPDELAWTAASRTALRKSPVWEKFHAFLVAETEVGNISRQEAVSMIPVLLLAVKPEHSVIDMCAAPGSKTAQILEALHANDSAVPSGLVIANDADQVRAHMLVRQTKRLQSPCLIVSNHEAQQFPAIHLQNDDPATGTNTLQFDRILCDVPCAGDGTMRKNKPIWKTWNQNNGNALHNVQFSILRRACELLKVGGRVVYSTCSFNPVENEAVVAELLRRSNGAMELVDVSSELSALKRRPGLTKWKVMAKDGNVFEKFEDVPKRDRTYKAIHESFFPQSDLERLGLDRCIRIYPHLQNTGGFFIAVLQKTAPIGRLDKPKVAATTEEAAETKEEPLAEAESDETVKRVKTEGASAEDETNDLPAEEQSEPADASDDVEVKEEGAPADVKGKKDHKLQKAWSGAGENPFLFISADSEVVSDFQKHYGLSTDFPQDQFLVRTETDQNRVIYFVSKSVKDVLTAKNSGRLKIVNTGIRMFTRYHKKDAEAMSQVPCPYRINHDGLSILAPHLSKNLHITVPLSDIVTMIKWEYPKFGLLSEEIRKRVEALPMGSCLFEFDPELEKEVTGTIHNRFILPIWRGAASLSLLLNKQERRSLMHRLTGQELTEFTSGLEKDKIKKEKVEGEGEGEEASAMDVEEVKEDVKEEGVKEEA
ncbi:tRNA (cytosine(34)-C(5))-methyltransferase [Rhizophlyctis rosea]|nr:tRNA (cytosine(34)-C(5))-methyltransferase [Rhizophlyctis rosea]